MNAKSTATPKDPRLWVIRRAIKRKIGRRANNATAENINKDTFGFESSLDAKRTEENMAALIEMESGNRVWEKGEEE